MTKIHSLRQIEIVKALANHHHFGLAAKALRVSQPALTRSLKQLEAELGVTLFDRQGVTPTPFGEIVLRHGERAAAEFHELMREVALTKGLEIGELRIAAGPYPADISASGPSACCRRSIPTCLLNCKSSITPARSRTSARVRSISGSPRCRKPRATPIARWVGQKVRQCFLLAAEHPLAGNRPLAIEDLLDFPGSGQASPDGCARRLPVIDKPFGTFDELEDRFHPPSWSKPSRRLSGSSLGGWASGPRSRSRSSPSSRRDGA